MDNINSLIDLAESEKVLSEIENVNENIQNTINQLIWEEKEFIDCNIDKNVYLSSLYYMIYWYHRVKKNPKLQEKIYNWLLEYFSSNENKVNLIDTLIKDEKLWEAATKYILKYLTAKPTVDLVISTTWDDWEKYILCNERTFFPEWNALPGWIINDEDEDNELWLQANIFAALRVAGQKVIQEENLIYWKEENEDEKSYFFVSNKTWTLKIKLYEQDSVWYKYKDKLNQIIKPSDFRHLVDTKWYSMELIWEIPKEWNHWVKKSEIMDLDNENWGLAFSHHRNIMAYLSWKSSVEKERDFSHKKWIRDIINEPMDYQKSIKQRFEDNDNDLNTSMPELFPIVEKMKEKLNSDEINELCWKNNILFWLRTQVFNSLEHVSFKSRTICPYLPTLHAIFKTISFMDLIAREEIWFYVTANTDWSMNKEMIKYASFHMKKYEYHLNDLLNKIPDEILIPTYEHLGATDLMKTRCTKLRFIGLSDDFLYVDEFDQSPEEFLMHDVDHSYRMSEADEEYCRKTGRDIDEVMEESYGFSKEYLEKIKIRKTDSVEDKEMKKLKKIILFEITHEDWKPFLRDVIIEWIQELEWQTVHYEIPYTDEQWHTDIIDTTNQTFSPLAFVRHKLQHGFFDRVDNQISQIVAPEYRTAEKVAKAAYEILKDLDAYPSKDARVDEKWDVSYKWLLERTCSVSPNKVHNKNFEDPSIAEYWDWNSWTWNLRYES